MRRLTTGTDVWATFSPDGKWIVFTRYADDVALWKVSAEGGEAVKLTNFSGYPLAPAVSPDSRLVAFYLFKNMPSSQIAIVPIEGGEIVKAFDIALKHSDNEKNVVQWTADGQAINYTILRDGISNIWRQPIDGSPPSQITNFTERRIFNFAYSPNGKQLALSRGTFNRDAILISNFE